MSRLQRFYKNGKFQFKPLSQFNCFLILFDLKENKTNLPSMFILSWKQSIQNPSTCCGCLYFRDGTGSQKSSNFFPFFFFFFLLRNATFNLYLYLFESRLYEICLTSSHDSYGYLFKSVGAISGCLNLWIQYLHP